MVSVLGGLDGLAESVVLEAGSALSDDDLLVELEEDLRLSFL